MGVGHVAKVEDAGDPFNEGEGGTRPSTNVWKAATMVGMRVEHKGRRSWLAGAEGAEEASLDF